MGVEEDFGKALRAYRLARQLTQAQLAAQGGVALRTLAGWELGNHLPGVQEISGVADAMNLAPEERRFLATLLPTQKAGKLLRAAPAWADVSPPPGTGDLIRGLRWRRRLSREQLADGLGVHRTTVTRWEGSQTIPNEDTRLRLCDLLGAFPAERTALLASPGVPLWDGNAPGLEECQRQVERLAQEAYFAVNPLFDLRAYLLTGAVWHLAARNPQARPLLARVYSAHAQFACIRGDDTAALGFADRAFQMLRQNMALHEGILTKVFWAGSNALTHQSPQFGPKRNLQQAKQWLALVQTPTVRANLLLSAAWWAHQVGSLREQRDYWQAAKAIVDRFAQPSPTFNASIQSTYADILIAAGRYDEGLEAGSQAAITSYVSEIERSVFHTSVFMKMDSRSEADNSLRRLYSLIAVHQADYYREGADELAAQLERMA